MVTGWQIVGFSLGCTLWAKTNDRCFFFLHRKEVAIVRQSGRSELNIQSGSSAKPTDPLLL